MDLTSLFQAGSLRSPLSRSANPSDLQTWGRGVMQRIGRKKVTTAVARKLSVILHCMWTTGEPFLWTAPVVVATA